MQATEPSEVPLISSPSPQDEGGEDCLALCMSGGGYRAMLFHLGGLVALNWSKRTAPTVFESAIVRPIRAMASTTIDVRSILGGLFWFGSVSDRVIKPGQPPG